MLYPFQSGFRIYRAKPDPHYLDWEGRMVTCLLLFLLHQSLYLDFSELSLMDMKKRKGRIVCMFVCWCLLSVRSPNTGFPVRCVSELLHRLLGKPSLCRSLEGEDALGLPTAPPTRCLLPTSRSLTVQYTRIHHWRETPSGGLLGHCSFFWNMIADCSSQPAFFKSLWVRNQGHTSALPRVISQHSSLIATLNWA